MINNLNLLKANSLKKFSFKGNDQDTAIVQRNKPRIAVIDEFSIPTVDLNADGIKDVPHGKVVKRILERNLDCDVVEFTNDKQVKILTDFLPEQLQKVEQDGQFDAVNISAGLQKSLRIIAKKAGIPDLTPDNLHLHREQIRQWCLDSRADNAYRVIESVENLTQKGVPVYFAGGNKGPESINLFGVARGAINVGAVTANNERVPSSACNSMLEYAQGVYGVEKVYDKSGNLLGYSLNGDGIIDFKPEEVVQGESAVEKFNGQPLSKVGANISDYKKKIAHENPQTRLDVGKDDPVRKKLFYVGELAKRQPELSSEIELRKANNSEFLTFDNKLGFILDNQHRIKFNPDGINRENLVGVIRGTSFADPARVAEVLKGS